MMRKFRRVAYFVVLSLVYIPLGWYAQANAATCTHEDYCTTKNPLYKSGYGGQCTAYAWGRAYGKMGISIQFTQNWDRHGKNWYRLVKSLPRGRQVQDNSIAVFAGDSSNKNGHVAYVEYVKNGKVYFTEANVSTYSKYNGNYGGGYDGYIKSKTISQFENRGKGVGKIVGYIYLSGNSSLSSLKVYCPSSVSENSSSAGNCSATAYYFNGTNKDVTGSVSWGDNSRALYVKNGRLTTYSVSSDVNVTVTASYGNRQGSATVWIKDGSIAGGKTLDGKDPHATGCDRDGRTVASESNSYGKIELRWSNSCKTNWTRVKADHSYSTEAYLWRSSDRLFQTTYGTGTIWTPMLYAPNITACASGKVKGKRSSWTCR